MTIDWKVWKPYLCNVKPASILVDLDLRRLAPIEEKPWLMWAWVYFQSPRYDGLSSDREAPTLYEIEDALYARVSTICGALPCGRITTEGRREFYFYGEGELDFRRAVETALNPFEGYRFDLGTQSDPLWRQYLNVLYPSLKSLQKIANMDTLDVLAKNGDVHTVPREVQHWLFFRSQEARSSFRNAVSAAGFNVASESTSEGDLPFVISVLHVQPVDQTSIDNTVLQLLKLCQDFEGEYDGWEAPVIAQ